MVIGCCSSSLIAGIVAAATSQRCFSCCYALIMGIFGLCALHMCVCVPVCAKCTWVCAADKAASESRVSASLAIKTTRSNASLLLLLLRRNAAPVLCNAALTLVLALLLLFFRLLFLRPPPPPPPHCCVVFVAATQFGDLLNRLCRHFSQNRNTHTHTKRHTHAHRERGRERQGRDTLTFKYGSKARSLRVLAPHFLIGLVFLAFQNTNTSTHQHTGTRTQVHPYGGAPESRA